MVVDISWQLSPCDELNLVNSDGFGAVVRHLLDRRSAAHETRKPAS